MILDTVQLRTLVAIAETGSFTRAAGQLNLTQSAISLHIKRLEEQVGRKLIDRGPRKLALTQEGELLLGYARRILALHKEAEGLLGQADMSGTVRFGAPEYFDSAVLAMLLAHFRRQHPCVQLEISIGLGPDMRREFEGGNLDVAIINVEPGVSDGTVLGGDERVWVAGLEFRRPEGAALPLVLFPPGCDWRRLATDTLDRSAISWTVALTSSGVTGLNAGIEAGLGVSVAPAKGVSRSMHEVGGELGLPALPAFEYRLVESPGAPPAARRLAYAIREVFAYDEAEAAS
ncbi:MAG: LysR substrate-binding domain-containing protein [Hyphomicrobium sp.]|jgi:DNA-binding transcriptional LysR family regulator